jgi:protocatechuate 3,4-dioxygenase beta subunit
MADATYTARDWSTQPAYIHPAYKSTPLRGPTKPLVVVPQSLSELTGPVYGHDAVGAMDADLTKNAAKNGEVLGERIIVTGRVLDDSGRPQPNTLIEIWQCNAAGRYNHVFDQHDAPLDPNFLGAGRCVTDANGVYKFYTIRPGAYPWPNHPNAWRPAHIHFSLFGPAFVSRLVTQSYFEGDPLCPYDPIYNASPEGARELLVKKFSMDDTEEGYAIAYRFDFVLRGPKATPMEVDMGGKGR